MDSDSIIVLISTNNCSHACKSLLLTIDDGMYKFIIKTFTMNKVCFRNFVLIVTSKTISVFDVFDVVLIFFSTVVLNLKEKRKF
jgi:hypothetical protein